MLAKWTGDVMADLHVYGIEVRELARRAGYTPEYMSKLLNGKRQPRDAEKNVRAALDALIKEKEGKI